MYINKFAVHFMLSVNFVQNPRHTNKYYYTRSTKKCTCDIYLKTIFGNIQINQEINPKKEKRGPKEI